MCDHSGQCLLLSAEVGGPQNLMLCALVKCQLVCSHIIMTTESCQCQQYSAADSRCKQSACVLGKHFKTVTS